MRINGEEYVLSQRRAVDYIELGLATSKHEEPDQLSNTITMAKVVCDSLKATYFRLGMLRGFRYRRFLKPECVTWLLESISTSDLYDACGDVSDLEGLKKKAQELASRLGD